ncbi:MAG: alpha/beta hydrolase [Bacteroidia bacterium]|nr:alpha/beta hydrolase [Bacteroidia bacterium]
MPPLIRQLSNVGNRFFTTSGYINMEYLLKGDPSSETVLFLHGVGLGCRVFLPNIDYFANDYQVLAVSLRGHGLSDPPQDISEKSYSIELMLHDLVELTWALNIQNFHLVGNSLGGVLGYELLRRDPDSLLSLTTFGAPPRHEGGRMAISLADKLLNTTGKIRGRKKQAQIFARQLSDNPETISFLVDEIFPTTHWQGLKPVRYNLANIDYIADLASSDVPLLFLEPEDDFMNKLSAARRAMKDVLHALENRDHVRHEVLPGAGHLANLDNPKAFNEFMLNYLKSLG